MFKDQEMQSHFLIFTSFHHFSGSDHIPGPVEDLHATRVTNTSISLEWIPSRETSNSSDNQIDDYLVQYDKVNNMTMYETVVKSENVNICKTPSPILLRF